MHRYYLIHPKCGKPAFFYDGHPLQGELIMASRVTYPDGTRPREFDKARCGSCDEPLTATDVILKNLRPVLGASLS